MSVLITGASSGFGAAITRSFVEQGQRVIICARRIERLQELAASCGDLAHPLAMDVTAPASIAAALTSLEALPEAWRTVDVLVNNAGLALGVNPAQTALTEDWDTMVNTNICGLMHVTHALLPAMLARRAGLIINLGSVAGAYPYPGGNVYGATKAFVAQFTRNLRADLVGTGVRATCLAPGLCGGTEFSEVRLKGDRMAAQQVYAGTQPLTADDIAQTVVWMAGLPAHININYLEMMPVCQGFGGFAIARTQADGPS